MVSGLVLGALALIVACSPVVEGADVGGELINSEPGQKVDPLANTVWYLHAYGTQDALQSPVTDAVPTIEFGEGTLSGSAGCNSYFADYWVEGASLELGAVASTEMWCDGLMEQETEFLRMLSAAQSFSVRDGELVLETGNGILVFSDAAPLPEVAVDGTLWQLETIGVGEIAQSVIDGTQITVKFSEGQVSGHTGCNAFSASYSLDGDLVEFGPMATTLQDCGDQVMEQEAHVLALLAAAEKLLLDGDRLIIESEDGWLAFLVPQDRPLTDTVWSLQGINQGDAIVSTWVDVEITAVFENGKMSGFAGCNQYSAAYDEQNGTLSLGPVILTRMSCENDRNQREADYVSALEGVGRISIEMDLLTLLDAQGNPSLIFKAQAE